ncbi:MAG: ATP-dependent DNA helicase RecG [Oscillospiraceae bacterium]|jgi:ATP-dependent DNA helicase RecG|nr:ATP-dependent DNA helicase RecG [Oscillospiraceae bacterium]
MNLQTDVRYLKGVGDRRAAQLRKLGIACVGDLLRHYPRSYADWRTIIPIQQVPVGEPCCIRAIVDHDPKESVIRRGMTIYKTEVTDGAGTMGIILYNAKYLAAKLRAGEEFLFYGRVGGNLVQREMSAPQIAPVTEERLRPVYALTEGISAAWLEGLMLRTLEQIAPDLRDPLPEELRRDWDLVPLGEALWGMHRPADEAAADRARRRLVFEELLLLQLGLARLREQGRDRRAPVLTGRGAEDFLEGLPFVPTEAQRRAVGEAAADLGWERPMCRLLQGDVGSGKTAVAAALLYLATKNGGQGAMLAPTELLARQHHQTLSRLLPQPPALLIGATPAAEKRKVKAGLADGSIPLAVGTHALLQEDVRFARLALAVVDEQHRFGVAQRAALAERNGGAPHVLVMSATPIPRTLAMIIYGDLDISVLDELPPGRTPVETYCVGSALRQRVYRYIRRHLDEGKQGYIVCPRVEEDGESGLSAASEYAERLRTGEFRNYPVGLLHGKLRPKQKEEVMRAFVAGELRLLVATTVIEVGVDVPNACIMVVENAERFGLSQLHQLRGRVGRGTGRSTCILISDAENEAAASRHEILCQSSDGFAIAEEDLRLRGPGDFFGARQHGLPELKLANMLTDTEVLRQTQEAAAGILRADSALDQPEHTALRESVARMFGENWGM